jgi:hypothetical protein
VKSVFLPGVKKMDKIFGSDYRITVRDEEQCFITAADKVYAMSLRKDVVLPETTIPVHVVELPKPLSIVPEPVIEFILAADFEPTMKVNDLVVLIYKVPCCVGFIGAIDHAAHTVTIRPIAVNMSRGAIVFLTVLPETADEECLYILRPLNTAYAHWEGSWHVVGTDVTLFKKAMDLHLADQTSHITAEERAKWSSGGNFVGAVTYFNLLPSNAHFSDWAIVTSEGGIYQVDIEGKWRQVHIFKGRNFEEEPIKANETEEELLKRSDVVNSLDSESVQLPLSAAMGRQLAESMAPPNAYQHLFNFNFTKTAIMKYQELFTANNIGPTNLLEYIYHGKVPRWASIRLSVRDEQVALFDRNTALYIRVFGKTADGASQILGEWHVLGEVSVMNTYWLYPQTKTTSMFLMLPEMTITAGLYEPYTNTWPAYKHADTGSHELKGSFELLMHSA